MVENNRGAAAHNMRVFTVCAQPNRTVAQSPPVASPGGAQASGSVACPTGEVPLSGGVSSVSTDLYTDLNASSPTAGGWKVRMNNVSSTATDFTV